MGGTRLRAVHKTADKTELLQAYAQDSGNETLPKGGLKIRNHTGHLSFGALITSHALRVQTYFYFGLIFVLGRLKKLALQSMTLKWAISKSNTSTRITKKQQQLILTSS